MESLPTYRKFPGPTGVETPAEVTIHRPIPRRAVPLAGIKKMIFPKKPMEIQLGAETTTSWDRKHVLRLIIFWLVLVPGVLALFLALSVLLFTLLNL